MDQAKKSKRIKIIALIAAFGLACVCLATIAFGVMCAGVVDVGKKEQVRIIALTLKSEAEGHPRELEYRTELDELAERGSRGEVAFLTFGILQNRFDDVRRDGVVDDTELDFVMELISDINRSDGEVPIERYPAGR